MKEIFEIDNLDGYEFQDLVARIMKKRNYHNVKVQQKSGDFGKDILMKGPNGEIFVVECKHQKLVGRPVLQKLQGAMEHERNNTNSDVYGIVVTSGKFSPAAKAYEEEFGTLELIDGADLRRMCEKQNIIVMNGKIQAVTNESFIVMPEEESKDISLKNYSYIYGNENFNPKTSTKLILLPVFYLKYRVYLSTSTSSGTIVDNYQKESEIAIDGLTAEILGEDLLNFYFSENITKTPIPEIHSSKRKAFKYAEQDMEKTALEHAINEHTHVVHYRGKNNVYYRKTSRPTHQDISIKELEYLYMPYWINSLSIADHKYHQEFFTNDHEPLYRKDELRRCTICEELKKSYSEMFICIQCARLTCKKHKRIDYLDKKTPICVIDALPLKLFLQSKYFANLENRKIYKKQLASFPFYKKIWEDKFVVYGFIFLVIISLISFIIYYTNIFQFAGTNYR